MNLEKLLSLEDIGFQVMPNHFFEEVVDFKEPKKETRTLFLFAGLLYEPKSRELEGAFKVRT